MSTKYFAPGQHLAFSFGADRDVFVLREPAAFGEPSKLHHYDLEGRELGVDPAPSQAHFFVLRDDSTPVFAMTQGVGLDGVKWLSIDGVVHECSGVIRAMAPGPERALAVLTDSHLEIWRDGERAVHATAHAKGGESIAWAGDRIVTGGMDKRITLWSTDGRQLASGSCTKPRKIVVQEDVVHVACGNGDLARWSLGDLKKLGKPITHQWEGARGRVALHSLAVQIGRAYTGADDKYVRCFEDGQLVWQTEAGGQFELGYDRILVRDFGTDYTFTELDLDGARI